MLQVGMEFEPLAGGLQISSFAKGWIRGWFWHEKAATREGCGSGSDRFRRR